VSLPKFDLRKEGRPDRACNHPGADKSESVRLHETTPTACGLFLSFGRGRQDGMLGMPPSRWSISHRPSRASGHAPMARLASILFQFIGWGARAFASR
jgi:hypothetical protein